MRTAGEKRTKETNLPADAGEIAASLGGRKVASQAIKGTSWGCNRLKAAVANPAVRVQAWEEENGTIKGKKEKLC